MGLRINDIAPNFTADSTNGPITLHDWIGDGYAIIFSHPKDFTPVCTTEFGAVAQLAGEFAKRRTKVMGVSVDKVEDHLKDALSKGARVVVGGTQLALPVPQPPGAEVDLCLRPQALSVRPAGPEEPLGPREIRGRIVASLYRATRSDLEIELAGGLVTAEVPATAVFSPDQPVAVGLDAERLLVFPAESA